MSGPDVSRVNKDMKDTEHVAVDDEQETFAVDKCPWCDRVTAYASFKDCHTVRGWEGIKQ